MNKDAMLRWLALIGKVLALVVGLAAYQSWIPEKWLPVAVLVFGAASVLKDAVNRLIDLVDDGVENQSAR